jgi:hypothetical protein
MEGRGKSQMDKYKEFTNDWNYDTGCFLTLLLFLRLEKFQVLDFCCSKCKAKTSNISSQKHGSADLWFSNYGPFTCCNLTGKAPGEHN